MFKVYNKNTRTRCEICSELTIKTPERRQWRHSGVFIVNFEHISYLVLMFLLLSRLMPAGCKQVVGKTATLNICKFIKRVHCGMRILLCKLKTGNLESAVDIFVDLDLRRLRRESVAVFDDINFLLYLHFERRVQDATIAD